MIKNFIFNWIIFIYVSIIFTAIDIQYYSGECVKRVEYKLKVVMTIFIHHIIGTVLNFGFLSNNKLFLSFFCLGNIIVILHWIFNKNRCFITQNLNKLCDFPKERLFPEFFGIIGLKKYNWWNQWGNILYNVIVFFIALYKIFYL